MEMISKLLSSKEFVAVALSVVGGTGSFLQGCRSDKLKKTWLNLITELVLSVTTGLSLLYIGSWQSWEPALINSLVLILTNNGGDTLAKAKDILASALKNKINFGGEIK